MIDPTGLEQAAMDYAGKMAGEYLDEIKTTNLATMSEGEWSTLINVICSGFLEHLQTEVGRIEADARYLRNKIEPIPS